MSGRNRKKLAKLLMEKSYREGDFILSSGKKSGYYFDCRVAALSAQGSWLIGRLFLEMLEDGDVAGVAGMSVGADPLVAAVACASWERRESLWRIGRQPLNALIVRKEAKEHGMGQFVEGLANFRAGDRIAVLDDVVTTGGSLLKACGRVQDAGLVVGKVCAILDREEGGAENILKETGLKLEAIYTRESLVALGKD